MKPAVRVEKALPVVLNKAPVPAFEIAARSDGTTNPSRPFPEAPTLRMVVVGVAPVIRNTPNTFTSRSTTATVTLRFKEAAAETACAMTVFTSSGVRDPAVAFVLFGIGNDEPGVGTA